ncbi:MAG TPA: hypothetical protein VFX76_10745 [Roseiflexaceae bacterium]|nr:hypothetical protein [Roseiflexaceae bacterium]
MDDRQRDLLMVACREAYRCLADRNRPEIMVEGRMIHSDAELAGALRHFARELFALQAERNHMLRELEPLWEAQLGGALRRAVDILEQAREDELGNGSEEQHSARLSDGDLVLLRILAAKPEPKQADSVV